MKTLKVVTAIAVVFFFASISGCAEEVTTQERLAEVRSKAEDIDSYRVDMTMEMDMMGQTMTTVAHIAFKKPDKFYTKTEMGTMGGATHEVYSTRDVMWTYSSMTNTAMKMDKKSFRGAGPGGAGASVSMGITDPFMGLSEDRIEYVGDEDTSEGLAYVFEITLDWEGRRPPDAPDRPMLPEGKTIWVSADTGLPIKEIMIGKDGVTMMEQTYSDFEINPEIDDSVFEFIPPEGVHVTDMADMVKNRAKELQDRIASKMSTGKCITAQETKKYIGEIKTVCGKVASTKYATRNKWKPTFLNLDRPHPNDIFTVIIMGKDRHKFMARPEKFYKGKNVRVTGLITSFRKRGQDKPQIVIDEPSQIAIVVDEPS